MRATCLCFCILALAAGCEQEWDTEVVGYVEVIVGMPPGNVEAPVWTYTIIRVVNGDQKTRLFYDRSTRFVNTGRGSTLKWDFDRIYRARGKKDWIDPDASRDGPLQIIAIPDTTEKVWAFRVERLSEEESQELIESGRVVPRGLATTRTAGGSGSRLLEEERESAAKMELLRAASEDVKYQIRALEMRQAAAAGGTKRKEDQILLEAANEELENLRAYLENLQSELESIEDRVTTPE